MASLDETYDILVDDRSSTPSFSNGEDMHPSREEGASHGSQATEKQIPAISMSLFIPNNARHATVKPLTTCSRNHQHQLTAKFDDRSNVIMPAKSNRKE